MRIWPLLLILPVCALHALDTFPGAALPPAFFYRSSSTKSSAAQKTHGFGWLNKWSSVGRWALRGLGIGGGALTPLLAPKDVIASPFDPHPIPMWKGNVFFNGWCIRLTDHDTGIAWALIIGSFKKGGASSYTQHYIALTASDCTGWSYTSHAFPKPSDVIIETHSSGFRNHPSNFTWTSKEYGTLRVCDNGGSFRFNLPNFAASATFHDRVPWNAARPNGDGPEGWLAQTPLLPCHYFVHSLASKTSYKLHVTPEEEGEGGGGDGQSTAAATERCIEGKAYAHMEANYGDHFPVGWIWAQGVSPKREVKLIVTGGDFVIGGLKTLTWIIGYRSPRFKWDFRTPDFHNIKANIDYTNNSVHLLAVSGSRTLMIDIFGPPGSFGPPIYVPTPAGFSNCPGCSDSFTARARIRAIQGGEKDKLRIVEEHWLDLCALEFGGNMRRV